MRNIQKKSKLNASAEKSGQLSILRECLRYNQTCGLKAVEINLSLKIGHLMFFKNIFSFCPCNPPLCQQKKKNDVLLSSTRSL